MPIIVETGEGTPGANSYASVAELEAYAEYRLDISDYTTEDLESALVIASMDWLDGAHFLSGQRLTDDQGLHFPTRQHGFPAAIKQAALIAALLQLQGLLLVDLAGISVQGSVVSESKSVGPLSKSVTYKDGSAQMYGRILPPYLTGLLRLFLTGGRGRTYRI